MPAAASLLLLTALATGAPGTSGGTTAVANAVQQPNPNGEGPAQPPAGGEAPHRFGLGASMGVGNHGGAGGFRYFVNDRIGVDMNVGWYHATYSGQGSTLILSPSFLWMLTPPRAQADVDVRPYVGGGVNYVQGGQAVQTRTPTGVINTSDGSGFGGQVFGGVEMTFKSAKAIAISAEVAHYEVAATGLGAAGRAGTNFYLLFHFYLN